MWGKLPIPKYLAHVIYKDNAAGTTALQAGEVDVSQEFNSNVQDLWLKQKLPISTYLPDAPYGIGASLPTAFFNLASYGLDQLAVRKAIAIAIDYDTIIANAMTNQSATFAQVPRSLMNPTAGEQALYDPLSPSRPCSGLARTWMAPRSCWMPPVLRSAADGLRQYNGKTLLCSHLPQWLVRLAGRDRTGGCRRKSDRHRHHDQLPRLRPFIRPSSPTGLSRLAMTSS